MKSQKRKLEKFNLMVECASRKMYLSKLSDSAQDMYDKVGPT